MAMYSVLHPIIPLVSFVVVKVVEALVFLHMDVNSSDYVRYEKAEVYKFPGLWRLAYISFLLSWHLSREMRRLNRHLQSQSLALLNQRIPDAGLLQSA